MTERTNKKPRFARVVKDGQLWLRDREGFKMVGPFNSFAECLVHELKAESHADSIGGEQPRSSAG